VLVGHFGVDGVDEAFVAAVVAVRVKGPHGGVLAELGVLEVAGNGDDGGLAGLGIDAQDGEAVRAPAGTVVTGVSTHHQEVVTAIHRFDGGAGGEDAPDGVASHVEQVCGVAQ
jgi:hypothetical protein